MRFSNALIWPAAGLVGRAWATVGEVVDEDVMSHIESSNWGVKVVDGVSWRYFIDPREPDFVPNVIGEAVVPDEGHETEFDEAPVLSEGEVDLDGINLTDHELCQEAENCEVRTTDDGLSYIAFKEGMGPYSDWWNETLAVDASAEAADGDSMQAEALNNLETRGKACKYLTGKKKCTEVAMHHQRVNYGSKKPKQVIPKIKEHCGSIGCGGSFSMSTSVWRTVPKGATLHVTTNGAWLRGEKGHYMDLIGKAIRSKTAITNHAICIANPVLGGCDQYSLTTYRASRQFQVNRWIRANGRLGLHGSISINVKLEVKDSIVCSAVVGALNSALSGVPGAGYFGFLSALCNV